MKPFHANLLRIFAFFVTQCGILHATNYSSIKVPFPKDNRRIDVQLVYPESYRALKKEFIDITYKSLTEVEKIYGFSFRDDFSIYYDAATDFHNGLSTVIPTNRVYVHLETPLIMSSIGLSKDYLLETTIHELSHMITLQQRGGTFSFFDFFFGNTSRPNGAWPLWIHEGLAVWAESFSGGRGQSGVIHNDLRKYSEYYRRSGQHPLNDRSLDGPHSVFLNWKNRHSLVEKGSIPYHFGYLLFKEIEKQYPSKKIGDFVKESKYSLGSAFRLSFREWGVDLDKSFSLARKKWGHYNSQNTVPKSEGELTLKEAPSLIGPFNSGHQSSWISREKNGKHYLNRIKSHKKSIRKTLWKYSYQSPLEAYFNQKKNVWIVLTRNAAISTNHQSRRKLSLYNEEGSHRCSFPIADKLREIHFNREILSWIRSDQKGFHIFEKARIRDYRNCRLGKVERIAQSRVPLERLSSPYTNGKFHAFSRATGRNLTSEHLETNYFKIESKAALTQVQQIPNSYCSKDALACLIAMELGKNYRGPVLIYANKKHSVYKKVPYLKTGSKGVVFDPQMGRFLRIDEFWEKDQLNLFTQKSFDGDLFSARFQRLLKNDSAIEKTPPSKNTRPYYAWSSLWPEYWLPNFSVYDKGYFVSGFTEFQDLRKKWSGSFSAGYDSYTQRPFSSASIQRSQLGLGFDKASLSGAYSPRVTSNKVQDRYFANFSLSASSFLFSNWILSLNPKLSYLFGSETPGVLGYNYVAPGVGWSLFSPRTQNHNSPSYQISKNRWSFQSHGNFRWLKAQDLYANTILQGNIWRTGFQIMAEYAETDLRNYPAVFYEWGGRASFSTQDLGFLARGYGERIGPATKVGRAAAQWGFKLFNPQWALSWNRAHLKDVELRFLYEILSSDLNFDVNGKLLQTNIQFGDDLFKTAGVEIDLFTQILQYANMKYTLGFYKGFDLGGETRFSLTLKSSLNL